MVEPERRRANDDLLARVDEKTSRFSEDIVEVKSAIRDTNAALQGIYKILERNYVTQAEFRPVRWLVYGGVGTVLSTILLALLAMVVIQGG